MGEPLSGTLPFGRAELNFNNGFADHYAKQWEQTLAWMRRELARAASERDASRSRSPERLEQLRHRLRKAVGAELFHSPEAVSRMVTEWRGEREYSYRIERDGKVCSEGRLFLPDGAVRGAVIGLALPESEDYKQAEAWASSVVGDGLVFLLPELAGGGRSLADDPAYHWYAYPDRELIHFYAFLCGGALAGVEAAELEGIAAALRAGAEEASPLPLAIDARGEAALSGLVYAALFPESVNALFLNAADVHALNHQEEDALANTIWGFHREFDFLTLLQLNEADAYLAEPGATPHPASAQAVLWFAGEEGRRPPVLAGPGDAPRLWANGLGPGRGLHLSLPAKPPTDESPDQQGEAAQGRPSTMKRRILLFESLYQEAGEHRQQRHDVDRLSLPAYREGVSAALAAVMGPPLPRSETPTVKTRRLPADETALYDHYQVLLESVPGVETAGHLLVPREAGPHPAVICQHGLMGRPDELTSAGTSWVYSRIAHVLAEKGFVVYVPFMTWGWGGNPARNALAKHAYALGFTPNRFEAAQLSAIVDFLQQRSEVRPDRIGFYGLSYGGHAGVWLGACEARLAAVVVSGHFNDWHRKLTCLDVAAPAVRPTSYLSYDEGLDMFTYDIARRLGHAEMATLHAPRPFMVENGLRDAVTPTDWVEEEFGKVLQVYQHCGASALAQLAHFNGPHRIWGEESVAFLRKHLSVN